MKDKLREIIDEYFIADSWEEKTEDIVKALHSLYLESLPKEKDEDPDYVPSAKEPIYKQFDIGYCRGRNEVLKDIRERWSK